MRSVEIVYDRANQRPWVAVDRQSGGELLRLQNCDQLQKVCVRLDWKLVADLPSERTARVKPAPVAFRRLVRG
jgi:hypothetical protein